MRPADRNYERFGDLTFDDFRRMAADDSLSKYEKIGFPDEYRAGAEEAIFADIVTKLPALDGRAKTILDIGPGCSDLPRMLDRLCQRCGHTLILVDSEEMLAHHPDRPGLDKFAARFPDCPELLDRYRGGVDAILAYSVLHYVFPEQSVFAFLDAAMELVAPGGGMLIGDVPNASKRVRFFSSAAGRRYHREFTGSDEHPPVTGGERDQIDDDVILALLAHARAAGCDAYVVAQREDLPMANRREDILVRRP
jgi:cyclopropane fatty-acyl-phospholipid synthase-like methyltransferase